MRCLTLADALRERGAQCIFVCRRHSGHLLDLISQRGHQILVLPMLQGRGGSVWNGGAYSEWLGTDWASDALDTQKVLTDHMGNEVLDWLVVDHYSLDSRWELALRSKFRHIMVIDDLADRPHDCELLLDQTYGRDTTDYLKYVPTNCRILCGSQYALLRPEFALLRPYSLQRRSQPILHKLLISMGGVDKDNATGTILKALRSSLLPFDCRITVVMGTTAPWLDEVRKEVQDMPWATQVLVGVSDIAHLMADSDLSIGAAGATSWERCCLGLPSIVVQIAKNQDVILSHLIQAGAAMELVLSKQTIESELYYLIEKMKEPTTLAKISQMASAITDGIGVQRIMNNLNG